MGEDTYRPDDVKSKYFQLPHPAVMLGVTFGLGLTALCYYRPDAAPYSYLGPLGTLAEYLAVGQPFIMKLIWYFAVICHLGEAFYTIPASSGKGLESSTRVKWFLSTMCFGVFSLKKLIAYRPRSS